jgi:CDP-paratose 2-epimerase
MKVLVTGGCGLIGSHAAEYYHNKGDHVLVMDNLERSRLLGHEVSSERLNYNYNRLTSMGIDVVRFDVSNRSHWSELYASNFDAIIHCAGQCGVPTSIADPRRDYEVNAIGTMNACEAARRWGAKLVYASTNKVYPIHSGWTLEGERWRWWDKQMHILGWPVEGMYSDHCKGARTPYGNSKYLGDLTCQEWYHTYGVKTGVFRMSCIYGEHQMGFEEQGWATWFAIAQENRLPLTIYGDGRQVRDMLHVSDVVRAYDAFIQSDVDHGVWNLGGGPSNTLSLVECMDLLEKINPDKIFTTIEYKDWRPSDQRVYTSDIRELHSTFGWKPLVSPDEGMRKVSEWVKEVSEIF